MYIRQVAISKKCPSERDNGGKHEKIPQDLETVKKWYFYKIVVYHIASIDAYALKLLCHCEEARRADVAISRYKARNAVQKRTLYQEIPTVASLSRNDMCFR